MNSHDLAKILLSESNMDLTASVDVSTCDNDSGNRVFGSELYEAFRHGNEFILCFATADFNYTEQQAARIKKLEQKLNTCEIYEEELEQGQESYKQESRQWYERSKQLAEQNEALKAEIKNIKILLEIG